MILDGMNNVAAIERIMRQTIEQAPTVHVEYLAVCDPDSLEPLSVVVARAVLLGAVRIGSIRLIDNLLVNMPGERVALARIIHDGSSRNRRKCVPRSVSRISHERIQTHSFLRSRFTNDASRARAADRRLRQKCS